MTPLQPHETKLEGGPGTFDGFRTHAHPVTARIDWLILNCLEKIGTRPEERATLFRDPTDDRRWELTYPERDEHEVGDGPPQLRYLTDEEVQTRYAL